MRKSSPARTAPAPTAPAPTVATPIAVVGMACGLPGGINSPHKLWDALLRGDDLVPAVKLRQEDKTQLVSRLQFDLPKGWKSVETGWPRIGKNKFRIDNPLRKFDRPTGWIVAGKVGTRRA